MASAESVVEWRTLEDRAADAGFGLKVDHRPRYKGGRMEPILVLIFDNTEVYAHESSGRLLSFIEGWRAQRCSKYDVAAEA